MEHHETTLSDLPQDIFYYVAKYFDLLDFSSMMLANKSMLRNLETDLKLQYLFLENTPRKTLHSRAKIPLRAVYLEHLFLRAVKEDNTDLIAFALITPSYNTVLARIKPMREKNGLLQRQRGPVQRQDVLAKIFEHDAINVMTYIVETCLAEIDLPAKFEHLVTLTSLLVEYCFKDNTPSKRTVRYVLSVVKEFEESLLFSLIYVSSLHNACWGTSDVYAHDLFCHLIGLQKSFPEFKFNLNKTINSGKLQRLPKHSPEFESQVSLLEYAAYLESQKIFSLLIDHGAKFDVKKPYLAVALYNRDTILQKHPFIDYLIQLGADINIPLPAYLDSYQFDILKYWLTYQDMWYIEYLLEKGARTVVTEQVAALLNDPASKNRMNLALKAQLSGYGLLKQTPVILSASFSFKTSQRHEIDLKLNHEVVFNGNKFGKWSQNNDGILRIELNKKRVYSIQGSYGHVANMKKICETYLFVVVESFTTELVLLPYDAKLSDTEKIMHSYRSHNSTLRGLI